MVGQKYFRTILWCKLDEWTSKWPYNLVLLPQLKLIQTAFTLSGVLNTRPWIWCHTQHKITCWDEDCSVQFWLWFRWCGGVGGGGYDWGIWSWAWDQVKSVNTPGSMVTWIPSHLCLYIVMTLEEFFTATPCVSYSQGRIKILDKSRCTRVTTQSCLLLMWKVGLQSRSIVKSPLFSLFTGPATLKNHKHIFSANGMVTSVS